MHDSHTHKQTNWLKKNKLNVKVQFSIRLINSSVTPQRRKERGVIPPLFLTSALDGVEWWVSCSGRLTTVEISLDTHWIRGWVGGRSGRCGVEKKSLAPNEDLTPVVQQVISIYTHWAILALRKRQEEWYMLRVLLCLLSNHALKFGIWFNCSIKDKTESFGIAIYLKRLLLPTRYYRREWRVLGNLYNWQEKPNCLVKNSPRYHLVHCKSRKN
jgi:hypothetical protein